jgi:hypothetical protein
MATAQMKRVEPLFDATPLLDDPKALREKARKEGYLFFKNRLPIGEIDLLRQQILKIAQNHGWLHPTEGVTKGLAAPDAPRYQEKAGNGQTFYADVQKCRDFHALALHPRLVRPLEILFDEPVLPHSRNILRLLMPDSARYSTPPHQDNFYIGGSKETWTVWFPLGDCPEELGGLACAPGTHRLGNMETQKAEGAGGRGVAIDSETRWATSPMTCGDVLYFHSLTVHQGRDNRSDRVRLSCDYRYQPRSHPVRADSLIPHLNILTWDDIYTNWDSDDPVKYYWNAWDLNVFSRA